MGLSERIGFYQQIEQHRKHPLLVYVTSKREGVDAPMASDALACLIDQLDLLPDGTVDLDFMIASYGGDPMVAWRIMSLIRERVKRVSVLVPQSAYSAATLLALGADEIIMHPNSHLGPVDMQVTTVSEGKRILFSTEDISAFLDFVRDKLGITDQPAAKSWLADFQIWRYNLTCLFAFEVGKKVVRSRAMFAGLNYPNAENMFPRDVTSPGPDQRRGVVSSQQAPAVPVPPAKEQQPQPKKSDKSPQPEKSSK